MNLLGMVLRPVARRALRRLHRAHDRAADVQRSILRDLVATARDTRFGRDHGFDRIDDAEDFARSVPVRAYEAARPYFDAIRDGDADVCWPGRPLYLAKTSGTTSGAKFIPITKRSITHHIAAARNTLFAYVARTGSARFFGGKMIFLQGSPVLDDLNGISTGRLSGIVYHHVPAWLLRNRKPSYATNSIDDWDRKVEAIVRETIDADMRLVSGIPPWCARYFERLCTAYADQHGLDVADIDLKTLFPNLEVYVYGGLRYAPYRAAMSRWLGEGVATLETYPASEGFFAFQDDPEDPGLLLNLDAGMFFEFIPMANYGRDDARRLTIDEVDIDEQYALVVSSDAGLWGYDTGDTVRFTSLAPYRLVVTGRTKHFLSAFGEHVIQEEVEMAMAAAARALDLEVTEFTVAPLWSDGDHGDRHQWCIEAAGPAGWVDEAADVLDRALRSHNSYYDDLRAGDMLALPRITRIEPGGFARCLGELGKLGGQNKVKHLCNDRHLIDRLVAHAVPE